MGQLNLFLKYREMSVSHFLIETAKYAWVVYMDSAIEGTKNEKWKQPLGLSFRDEVSEIFLFQSNVPANLRSSQIGKWLIVQGII